MNIIDFHLHAPESDPGMDEYVRHMDDAGVTHGLVHAVMPGPHSSMGDNEFVLDAVQRHPDKLFGSVYVDLRDPIDENVTTMERFKAEGFVCIKMFPNLGFDPNDEEHEPLWETVEELGLMCLSHCGWLAPSGDKTSIQSITASPFHFEVPARRHPGINFIFAHFGGGATYLETLTLTSRLKNCYADVCPGWGKWVFENRMPGLDALYLSQILYGTDNKGAAYADDIAWWGKTLREMNRTEEEIRGFFHDNAAPLLGLDQSTE